MTTSEQKPQKEPDALFELESVTVNPPEVAALVENPEITIPELVHRVAIVRRRNIRAANRAQGVTAQAVEMPTDASTISGVSKAEQTPSTPAKKGRKPGKFVGGAFSSGLQRLVKRERFNPEAVETVSPVFIKLLAPNSLKQQLTPSGDRLVYDGLLFTPKEHKAITFSVRSLMIRIDGVVQAKEDGRTPSELHARSDELQRKALLRRDELVSQALLTVDEDIFQARRLRNEMEIPRLAHMTAKDMDSLIKAMNERYHAMLSAVMKNHRAGTEPVEAATLALDYLLANPDIEAATKYQRGLNRVYLGWSEGKKEILQRVQQNIQDELARDESVPQFS